MAIPCAIGLIATAGLCLRSPSTLRRKRAHDQRSVCRGRDGQVERSMGATRSVERLPLIRQRPASALRATRTPLKGLASYWCGERPCISPTSVRSRLSTRTPPSFCQEMRQAVAHSSVTSSPSLQGMPISSTPEHSCTAAGYAMDHQDERINVAWYVIRWA